tara:strand:+ start:1036 stop:1266 length:231 start_codon:yes stop_codon:yes gene_type:complete
MMDFDEQVSLEHLLFKERKCRTCGKTKDLIDGFYLTRKDRGDVPSSYSYECKDCTIERITKSRRRNTSYRWEYPDW